MPKKKVKSRKKKISYEQKMVSFEAVFQSESELSMFSEGENLTPENIEQFKPAKGHEIKAAKALQSLGFKVRHIGAFSISGEGPRELWQKVFQTKVERRSQPLSEAHPELGKVSYWSHIPETRFVIPDDVFV